MLDLRENTIAECPAITILLPLSVSAKCEAQHDHGAFVPCECDTDQEAQCAGDAAYVSTVATPWVKEGARICFHCAWLSANFLEFLAEGDGFCDFCTDGGKPTHFFFSASGVSCPTCWPDVRRGDPEPLSQEFKVVDGALTVTTF